MIKMYHFFILFSKSLDIYYRARPPVSLSDLGTVRFPVERVENWRAKVQQGCACPDHVFCPALGFEFSGVESKV